MPCCLSARSEKLQRRYCIDAAVSVSAPERLSPVQDYRMMIVYLDAENGQCIKIGSLKRL